MCLISPATLFAQWATIEGRVTDYLTSEPLKNCHVYVFEDYGVLTDQDGKFSIRIPEKYKEENLQISYVGYTTFDAPLSKLAGEFQEIELMEGALILPDNMIVVVPDPWDEFREVITYLSESYEDTDELYYAILNELEGIEPKAEQVKMAADEDMSRSLIITLLVLGGVVASLALKNHFIRTIKKIIPKATNQGV